MIVPSGVSSLFLHSHRLFRLGRGCLLVVALVSLAGGSGASPGRAASPGNDGIMVYRTMMPESGPSSFAVGFGNQLGFSYDPGRGGVNYIWRGEFADLGPTWKAKINEPAVIRGEIIYRESVRYPLRLGAGPHEPRYAFKGYTLVDGTVEFHYMIDGTLVRETIRVDGAGGIVRQFRADRPVGQWRYFVEPQPGMKIGSPEGQWDEQRKCITAPGGTEFAIHIQFEERAR